MTKINPTLAALLTLRGVTITDYRRLQAKDDAASRYIVARIDDEVEEIEVEARTRAQARLLKKKTARLSALGGRALGPAGSLTPKGGAR